MFEIFVNISNIIFKTADTHYGAKYLILKIKKELFFAMSKKIRTLADIVSTI